MHKANIYFNLDQINYYIYQGSQTFDKYRILLHMKHDDKMIYHLNKELKK
ncbi:hypothetical protein CPAV1605_1393 [seawater metagenome]|uniref:Uncharacterized protein n=1 Tax=seawater metagenome TaxID=1561972 RepID=A0A5E8CMJ4_9ZZZZ